jgi:hypothetical protein
VVGVVGVGAVRVDRPPPSGFLVHRRPASTDHLPSSSFAATAAALKQQDFDLQLTKMLEII